jgi:hypothetical protein
MSEHHTTQCLLPGTPLLKDPYRQQAALAPTEATFTENFASFDSPPCKGPCRTQCRHTQVKQDSC